MRLTGHRNSGQVGLLKLNGHWRRRWIGIRGIGIRSHGYASLGISNGRTFLMLCCERRVLLLLLLLLMLLLLVGLLLEVLRGSNELCSGWLEENRQTLQVMPRRIERAFILFSLCFVNTFDDQCEFRSRKVSPPVDFRWMKEAREGERESEREESMSEASN